MRQFLKAFYDRHAYHMALAFAFLVPVKLICAYIAAIPLILLWINNSWGEIGKRTLAASRFAVPFIFFALSVTASAFYGIDPLRSLKGLPSLFFFSLAVLVISDLLRDKSPIPLIMFLVCGQSLAALHSILEGGFNLQPGLFLGKVTEAGQLGLTIMAAVGTVICVTRSERSEAAQGGPHFLLGIVNTVFLTLVAFLPLLNLSGTVAAALCAATLVSFGASLYISRKSAKTGDYLTTILVPLLLAALLVNLKRGPWSGVITGALILLYFYEKRLILPLLAAAVCAIVFLQPVQDRLKQSSRDFFISGGRSIIWEIGGELAIRYPLGVGYKNSPFLQKYSPEIPPELKHFHNNLLNIVVENGWLTVMLFIWWILRLIKAGFELPESDPLKPLAVGISCAFIAWQVAGFVEYNFGDSEVMLLAFLLMGVINSILSRGVPSAENH